MKPRLKLAETRTPDGKPLALYEHDGAFAINCGGQELMHSQACASERLLGERGVEKLSRDQAARLLIGGLGLGFTLDSVLQALGPTAAVDVAELLPEVVEWNRAHLSALNGQRLDDPRVTVLIEDVGQLIRKAAPDTYDAILLDTDNGPIALVAESNNSLYSAKGIQAVFRALKPQGRAIFWSAGPDAAFESRLRKASFATQALPAKVHASAKRAAYLLYVADKPA